MICDSLKGPNGIIIDDCQVQHIEIYYIDTPSSPYFELELRSGPDEFIKKPIKLFEMPNKLYYPFSLSEINKEESLFLFLAIIYRMIRRSKTFTHKLRLEGKNQMEALRTSGGLLPCIMGFPKSRIIDSEFEVIDMKKWTKEPLFQKFLSELEEKYS